MTSTWTPWACWGGAQRRAALVSLSGWPSDTFLTNVADESRLHLWVPGSSPGGEEREEKGRSVSYCRMGSNHSPPSSLLWRLSDMENKLQSRMQWPLGGNSLTFRG